jgi:hypothetical protein
LLISVVRDDLGCRVVPSRSVSCWMWSRWPPDVRESGRGGTGGIPGLRDVKPQLVGLPGPDNAANPAATANAPASNVSHRVQAPTDADHRTAAPYKPPPTALVVDSGIRCCHHASNGPRELTWQVLDMALGRASPAPGSRRRRC